MPLRASILGNLGGNIKLEINEYFQRIGYEGDAKADVATLAAIHRAHALAIPYENLDVYLEQPVDQDITRIFRKIVQQGRGGWCYEMNGLLGWALREIGFDVTRHVGGVFRAEFGDEAFGNHLLHTVDLGETYIVDVGIGDFVKEPVLLREGAFSADGKAYQIERLDDGSWRFHNHENAMPPSFDFFYEAANEDQLRDTCSNLQTDPQSMFRQNLICQQMTPTGFKGLLGRVYNNTDEGLSAYLIQSEEELHTIIRDAFHIQLPSLDGLWGKVCARHDEVIASKES